MSLEDELVHWRRVLNQAVEPHDTYYQFREVFTPRVVTQLVDVAEAAQGFMNSQNALSSAGIPKWAREYTGLPTPVSPEEIVRLAFESRDARERLLGALEQLETR